MNNISGSNSIQEILENLGYTLTPDKDGWRARPLYRDSTNDTSLKIYQEGNFVDFSAGIKGNIIDLVKLSMGLESVEKAKEYLQNNNFSFVQKSAEISEPLIKSPKYKNKDFLNKLDKSDKAHEYWLNRGIKLEILKELGGGLYKNKYYFPIFENDNLLGWSARIVKGDSEKRWIIGGERKEFLYGDLENIKINKKVYIHEGISDFLTIKSLGINYNLVQFGTEISFKIINFLLRIPDVKIILCGNNDDAGRAAIVKNTKKLKKYFDFSQISSKFPPTKDINDFLLDSGSEEVYTWLSS